MGARVFISYSHKDEQLRNELEVHLTMLKRQGLIEPWHDRRLLAGDKLDRSIDEELNRADIFLLLISPDFIASDYCYEIEKGRALERHQEGTARLISVILRPCEWQETALGEFLVTPTDGKPISKWPDRDEAFQDVVKAIRKAVQQTGAAPSPTAARTPPSAVTPSAAAPARERPRSSNMRLRKDFSDADRDAFLFEAFEFMAEFFQGSLDELQARNDGIETRLRRKDGDCFTATVYRNGNKVAGGTIRVGNTFGPAITWLGDDSGRKNTHNESLSVGHDDQKLFLSPMGIPFGGPGQDAHLTHEGAAEYLWDLLISGLQGS
ncbi:TIR domain-containing protein [Pseudooceanicola sp. 216_PA32_1]|uniref:TIR domain-containing protein n=1 Tax=Pseudooceanicola pacificus TaxID=2676438 RepID=A0A844WGB5_9RHOB|nr:toll/interleukin-1 receptor domain-containing protein [Pseudooceanicola pacificus]MWB79870.1 TIR domain-containing protein [Pseudooceanicola pacificus]